jgi:hypothetical protein
MRSFVVVAALLAGTVGLAACGDDSTTAGSTGGSSTTEAPSSSSSAPVDDATTSTAEASTITTTLVNGKPHFATPEDAMTYLTIAWNADDETDLKHVTDPSARDELDAMHQVATNLRLDRCEENVERGDYTCYFDHDYPPHASTTMAMEDMTTGHAVFTVGPADTPGWYMTVLESCS